MNKIYKTLRISLFLVSCVQIAAAQLNISGVVTSSDDQLPLIGVNVYIRGETRGAVTDNNGYYLLKINSRSDTIIFSYIGYHEQRLVPGAGDVLNVVLEPEVRELEEIIVMAYTEKSRTEISSAVVSLSADRINDVTTGNVEDMLVGKVAGLHIQNASGQPGEAAQIRIRGVGSAFSQQMPLIVVDGIIGGSYNPNDIESVTILKDAGATGLYGSKAAAGVIIITTRKGQKGKTQFTFKTGYGLKYPETGQFEVMNGEELWQYHKLVFAPAVFSSVRPSVLKTLNYDWINNSFTRANIGNYYFSVSGGRDKVSYHVSADYLDDQGTALSSSFKRISLVSKVTMELTSRVTLETKVSGTGSKSESPYWTYTEMPFRMIPWDYPYDSTGTLIRDVSSWYSNTNTNIFHSSKYNTYGGSGTGAGADVRLDVRIFDWLSFSSLNSVGMGYGKYEEVQSPLTIDRKSVV